MRRTLSQIAQGVTPTGRSRHGGHVRGPGTGTSDSIDAKLSHDEFVLPADTVRKVGVRRLQDLVDKTHTPSGKPLRPGHFVDGGLVDTRRRQSTDMDAWAQRQEQQRAARNQATLARVNAQTEADDAAAQAVASANAPGAQPTAAVTQPGTGARGGVGGLAAVAFPNTARAVSGAMDDARTAYQQGGLGAAVGQSARVMGTPLIGLADDVATSAARVLNPAAQALKTFATGDATPIGQPTPAPVIAPTAQGAGAGRGQLNPPMANPAAALPSVARPVAVAPSMDRGGMTNSQVAQANPQGAVTARRGPGGTMEFSGQNVSGPVSYADASGAPVPGSGINGRGWGSFNVAPSGSNVAVGPNGSFAFSTDGAGNSAGAPATGVRGPLNTTTDLAGSQALPGSTQPSGHNVTSAGAQRAMVEDQGGRARLMATATGPGSGTVAPGSFTGGYSGVIGSTDTRGNMLGRSPEQQRRDAEVSASSIHKATAARGKGALDRLNAQDLLKERAAGDLVVTHAQQQGALDREDMQQTGETLRTNLTGQRYADANQLSRERLTLDQIAAGHQNRTNERIERAQVDLENAKTPQDQRSARARLMALAGKTDGEVWAHSPGGQVVDQKTQQLITVPSTIYNRRTGETRAGGGQVAAAAMPSSRDAMVKGQVYQTARGPALWDGSQFQSAR